MSVRCRTGDDQAPKKCPKFRKIITRKQCPADRLVEWWDSMSNLVTRLSTRTRPCFPGGKSKNSNHYDCCFLNAGDRVLRASGTRLAPTEAGAETLKLRLKDTPRSIKKVGAKLLLFLWNAGDRT